MDGNDLPKVTMEFLRSPLIREETAAWSWECTQCGERLYSGSPELHPREKVRDWHTCTHQTTGDPFYNKEQ